jgi:enamine deaminase RidA (YjgF/YER057c/UK114 family)
MPITFHNVAGRPDPPPGTSHASVATGGRLVHLAGQPGTDAQGETVPGGLAAQMEQALENVALALEAAGARPEDVVKSTLYVVDWDLGKMEALVAGSMAANARHAFSDAPVTLIGVDRLFVPDHLVEVEVVAVAGAA